MTRETKQIMIMVLLVLLMGAQCLNLIPPAGQANAQSFIYILLVMIDPRPRVSEPPTLKDEVKNV